MSEQKTEELQQYAVIETGGKQYRVSIGDRLAIGKLEGESGTEIVFDKVLAHKADGEAKLIVGTPLVDGAKVKAKTIKQMKDKKIDVFKKIRRHGFTKKIGHRQDLTAIEITSIDA